MDLKALKKALEAAMGKADMFRKMLADADTDELKASRQLEYESAITEVDAAQKTLETAIADHKRTVKAKELLKSVNDLNAPVVPEGTNLGTPEEPAVSGAPAAQAVNINEKSLFEENVFFKYMGGQKIPESQREQLNPEHSKKEFSPESTRGGIVIPKSVQERFFPEYFKKAIPMLSTDNDSAGGRSNLFTEDYRTELLALPPDTPKVWQRVTKKSTNSSTLEHPRLTQTDDNELGGVVVTRGTEGSNATATEADFELEQIATHKLDAYTTGSNRLFRLSRINLEMYIRELFRNALLKVWDNECVYGSGSGEALGIINTTDINEVGRATLNQISWTDIVNVMFGIKENHAAGAEFCLSRTARKYLMGELDEEGRPLFAPATNAGQPATLGGERWFEATAARSLGSDGDLMFGNFRHFWHVVEEDMVIARSEHAEFRKGLIAFRLEVYSGGELMYPRAFAFLNNATS